MKANETEWQSRVKGLLKAELKRRNLGYKELAEKLAADISGHTGLAKEAVTTLLRRYAMQASEVAMAIANNGLRTLAGNAAYHEGEIRWIVQNERVTRLTDIILRRTLLPFEDDISRPLLNSIASIMATKLNRSTEHRSNEIEMTSILLHGRYRIRSQPQDAQASS